MQRSALFSMQIDFVWHNVIRHCHATPRGCGYRLSGKFFMLITVIFKFIEQKPFEIPDIGSVNSNIFSNNTNSCDAAKIIRSHALEGYPCQKQPKRSIHGVGYAV